MKLLKRTIVILVLAAAVLTGYSFLNPVVKIDGTPYRYKTIEGIENLVAERENFYRDLDEATDKEIRAFFSGRRPGVHDITPSSPPDELTAILRRKHTSAENRDALYELNLESLLRDNRLRCALPPQVRTEKGFDELRLSLFTPHIKTINVNGTTFDENVVSLVQEHIKESWDDYTASVSQELEEKLSRVGKQMLDNLNTHKLLNDNVNLTEIISLPDRQSNAISFFNDYSDRLLAQCSFSGYGGSIIVPAIYKQRTEEQITKPYNFDRIMLPLLSDTHTKMMTGFEDFYSRNRNDVITKSFEQMKNNLAEKGNVNAGYDSPATVRLNNYLTNQLNMYKTMVASILGEDPQIYKTAIVTPVSLNESTGAVPLGTESFPLRIQYTDVSGTLYQSEALFLIEKEMKDYKVYFETLKTESLKQEAQKIGERMSANINSGTDTNVDVNAAAYGSLVAYFNAQIAQSAMVIENLLNQFRAEDIVQTVAQTKPQPLSAFEGCIKVSLPVSNVVYHNEIPLDQEAASYINETLDATRVEWGCVDNAKKNAINNKRKNQYVENTRRFRNPMYGIRGSEINDAVDWGIRQQRLSRPLFDSLIKACALPSLTSTENPAINPTVQKIDTSPLPLYVKKAKDGRLYDAVLVSGAEKAAHDLVPMLLDQLRSQTEETVIGQFDILHGNAAEWADERYSLGYKIAELKERFQKFLTKTSPESMIRTSIIPRDYKLEEFYKQNPEAAMYRSAMLKDFRLEEKLLSDLVDAVDFYKDLSTAMVSDYNDCALTGECVYVTVGETSLAHIEEGTDTVAAYINKVFPALLGTQVDIRFVEKVSMNKAPVRFLQVAEFFIPGVPLPADLAFDLGIELLFHFLESTLKDEYISAINTVLDTEKQKLLNIINEPIYGGKR